MSDKNLQEKEASKEEKKSIPEENIETSNELTQTEDVSDEVNEEVETEITDALPKTEEETITSEEENEEDEVEEESETEEEEENEEEEEIDYHSLSKKELIATFKKLLKDKPVQSLKNAVEEIRNEFIQAMRANDGGRYCGGQGGEVLASVVRQSGRDPFQRLR